MHIILRKYLLDIQICSEILCRAWNGDVYSTGRGMQDTPVWRASGRIFTWIIELVAIKRDTDREAAKHIYPPHLGK